MIFGLVVIGLALALNDTAAAMLASQRESRIRLGLQSRLAEARVQPPDLTRVEEPADETGVVYAREWKRVEMVNRDRIVLENLYELVIRARWPEDGQEQTEEASIYLYLPQ